MNRSPDGADDLDEWYGQRPVLHATMDLWNSFIGFGSDRWIRTVFDVLALYQQLQNHGFETWIQSLRNTLGLLRQGPRQWEQQTRIGWHLWVEMIRIHQQIQANFLRMYTSPLDRDFPIHEDPVNRWMKDFQTGFEQGRKRVRDRTTEEQTEPEWPVGEDSLRR